MKIGIVLENPLSVGGGFNQALNATLQLMRITREQHQVVVYTTISANVDPIQQLGIQVTNLAPAGIESLGKLMRTIVRRVGLAYFAQRSEAARLERALLSDGIDLAYFVSSSSLPNHFRCLNYVTTVFDLYHLDAPEFPEVGANGQFTVRERHFQTCLPRALLIVAGSKWVAKKISNNYGVDQDRVVVMPFEPSPFLSEGFAATSEATLKKYSLQKGYYFYPAQFWAHKNHVRLLEALAILVDSAQSEIDIRMVFCGGDQGNAGWVKRKAEQLNVAGRITYLGFVPAEDLRALYDGALAVVMPTYLGPTNIPPLEAWVMGRPLIHSAHISEQIGEAALFADADDAGSWAEAMLRVRDPSVAADLVIQGKRQLNLIDAERLVAEGQFIQKLNQFSQRRKCWE